MPPNQVLAAREPAAPEPAAEEVPALAAASASVPEAEAEAGPGAGQVTRLGVAPHPARLPFHFPCAREDGPAARSRRTDRRAPRRPGHGRTRCCCTSGGWNGT